MKYDGMNDEYVGGSNLTQMVIAAFAGAAIALLFAPATGRQTRSWLGDRTRQLKHGAGDRVDTVKNVIGEGAGVVKESIAAGKQAYARAADRAAASTGL